MHSKKNIYILDHELLEHRHIECFVNSSMTEHLLILKKHDNRSNKWDEKMLDESCVYNTFDMDS